jgi:pSer/pThr/pTyr-binding forkhead associated (FHA) protein
MNKLYLRIGSSPNNQLTLDDVGIDPYHLELFSDQYGNVFITDLDSNNGTFINDLPLKGFKLLKVGDKLRLGKNFDFDWENLVLKNNKQEISPKKTHKITHDDQVIKSLNEPNDISPVSIKSQLIIIYSCILILFLLLIYIL